MAAPLALALLLVMSADPLVRKTDLGSVRGLAQPATKTYAWLGIPYAKPPIGELRWRAPAKPEPWSGTRDAASFGAACAQIATFQGPPGKIGEVVGSEDCLTINIWRPASTEVLPVLVFIHGGANIAGYSGDPLYDGRELAARARAVVVSMNYRLGIFGWFLHPSLRTGMDELSASGNFAILDLLAALRFIQTNIAAFGGDADNVSVMGQSAGAVNAYSLMMSPLSEGLMKRVIALSGARMSKPREDRDQYAQKIFEKLSGPLRAQTTEALVKAAAGVPSSGWATADGVVLPKDPAAAIAAKKFRNIPLIIGVTREEGKFFIPDVFRIPEAERVALMNRCDPDKPTQPTFDALIKDRETFNARAAEMNKVITGLVEGTLAELGPKLDRVYMMRFDWAEQVEPWRTILGATHAMDLPFIFHNFGKNYFSCAFGRANAAGRETLSQAMIESIAAFIRTGDPKWKPWTQDAPSRLVWNVKISVVSP